MLSFMRAQYTLFQQGFNILDEIDPYMKKLAAQVRQNKQTQNTHTQKNRHAHTLHYNYYQYSYSSPVWQISLLTNNTHTGIIKVLCIQLSLHSPDVI